MNINDEGIMNINELFIEDGLYASDKKIKKVVIGKKVETIYEYAFKDCINLEEVDLSSSKIKDIYESCFEGCSKLDNIILPKNIKQIDIYSFANCTSLKSIVLNNVNDIKSLAFENCNNIEIIEIKNKRIKIHLDAFKGCNNQKNVLITCPEKYKNYFLTIFPNASINEKGFVLK
jgi:Leucine-rich repeat (LRR) protein